MKLKEVLQKHIQEHEVKRGDGLPNVCVRIMDSSGNLLKASPIGDFEFLKDYLSCEVVDFYGDDGVCNDVYDAWLVAVIDLAKGGAE